MGNITKQVEHVNHGLTTGKQGFTRTLQGVASVEQKRVVVGLAIIAIFKCGFLAQGLNLGIHARHAAFHVLASGVATQIGTRYQVSMDVASLNQDDFATSRACRCRGHISRA